MVAREGLQGARGRSPAAVVRTRLCQLFTLETLSTGLYGHGNRGRRSDKQQDAQHALLLRLVASTSTELLSESFLTCVQPADDKEEAPER